MFFKDAKVVIIFIPKIKKAKKSVNNSPSHKRNFDLSLTG